MPNNDYFISAQSKNGLGSILVTAVPNVNWFWNWRNIEYAVRIFNILKNNHNLKIYVLKFRFNNYIIFYKLWKNCLAPECGNQYFLNHNFKYMYFNFKWQNLSLSVL